MITLNIMFLGLIQGITEFLPVSSSGHLALFQQFIDTRQDNVFLDVILHVATLGAVLVFFSKDILALCRGLLADLKARKKSGHTGLFLAIVAGSIPTAIIGLGFKDHLESLFERPVIVGAMLVVTGIFTGLTYFRSGGNRPVYLWAALLIGIAQGLAITPGISRSGATIAVALFLGVKRESAGSFSFLLAIPAITGALLLKIGEIQPGSVTWAPIMAGAVVSFLAGLASLWLLIRFVNKGKLYYFSIYCFILGIASISFFALR
jgi:undecaprenyl-diphosphatase